MVAGKVILTALYMQPSRMQLVSVKRWLGSVQLMQERSSCNVMSTRSRPLCLCSKPREVGMQLDVQVDESDFCHGAT